MLYCFKETFSYCIVPTITFSTHALYYLSIERKNIGHFSMKDTGGRDLNEK